MSDFHFPLTSQRAFSGPTYSCSHLAQTLSKILDFNIELNNYTYKDLSPREQYF